MSLPTRQISVRATTSRAGSDSRVAGTALFLDQMATKVSQATNVAGRDWTQGSIVRNLLSLAWPVIIGSSLNTIGPTIDMVWVGRLGASSVAGVGVAGMLVSLLDAFKMGLDMGTRAMIARLVGAGNYE